MNSTKKRYFIRLVVLCLLITALIYTLSLKLIPQYNSYYVNINSDGDDVFDLLSPHQTEDIYEDHDHISQGQKGNKIQDYWREITPSQDGRLFVFSAYYDGRLKKPVIRILAAVLRQRKAQIYCIFKTENETLKILGKVVYHSDDQYLKYCAGRIECEVPKSAQRPPKYISIIGDDTLDNWHNHINMTLPVHDRSPSQEFRKGDFAVCSQPLHKNYSNVAALIEFIELYRVFGVDQFYFYYDNTSKDVRRVLDTYEHSGIVTVLPWQLDIPSDTEMRVDGIMVALSDCIYRAMYRYTYTIMVDLDEFIMPTENISLLELLQELEEPHTGIFVFQNVFFYLNWEDDSEWLNTTPSLSNFSDSNIPYLTTLRKTKRVSTPNRVGIRTKYIARPNKLITAGNHEAETFIPGFTELRVSPSKGLLHHYRCCEKESPNCVTKSYVVDRKTWRYASEMLPRVNQACAAAFPETKVCPENGAPGFSEKLVCPKNRYD